MTVWGADYNRSRLLSLYSLCLLITDSESLDYKAGSSGMQRNGILSWPLILPPKEEMKPLTAPIRFGIFEVQDGELRRQGVKIKLQEQPLQILMMLLERPGEVIAREELQKRLWAADTFVDFDRRLNRAVN